MKTIEERVEELAETLFPNAENIWARPNIEKRMCKDALIKIATEQKAIDDEERDTAVYNLLMLKLDAEKKLWTEKACEWIYEHFLDYCSDPIGCRFDDCARDLRKAMEE